MNHKDKMLSLIKKIKFSNKANALTIPIKEGKKAVAQLKIITSDFTDEDVKTLAHWRKANNAWFFSQFRVTNRGTKKWLKEQVINAEDRLLFWIQTPNNHFVGCIGICHVDFKGRTCEVDNVMRGVENAIPGVMTLSLNALLRWSFTVLKMKAVTLRVFSDNQRAIALYKRCGFKEIGKIPLKKVMKGKTTQWITIGKVRPKQIVARYSSQMYLKNPIDLSLNKVSYEN